MEKGDRSARIIDKPRIIEVGTKKYTYLDVCEFHKDKMTSFLNPQGEKELSETVSKKLKYKIYFAVFNLELIVNFFQVPAKDREGELWWGNMFRSLKRYEEQDKDYEINTVLVYIQYLVF